MDTKKSIIKRLTVVLGILIIVFVLIVSKIIYIQVKEGAFWRNFDDSIHLTKKLMIAERGTIYSEEGHVLSASLPYYDVYVDFMAPMMREDKGKFFYQKIDSLSVMCYKIFLDKTPIDYKNELIKHYKNKDRYYLLKKNIAYQQYKKMIRFPFLNKAKNKYSSGFVFVTKEKRVYPYGNLATRTIGFLRNNAIWNLGLEKAYDSILQGEKRYVLMKSIAGGAYAPIESSDLTPENGKDIVTTLNIKIQSIVEGALHNMLVKNKAEWGTCIVMEVETGKIKAIANLSHKVDSVYAEDINYALKRNEPGSTLKILSMLALLEDGYINIDDIVDLNGGELSYAKDVKMFDSEKHKVGKTTIKHAFAISSNVGVSRLVNKYYHNHPDDFMKYFQKLHLNTKTNFDLKAEELSPRIITPDSKYWSFSTSLPWVSIGYGVEITPLQTIMLYNAIANNGKMMKPYLVSKILSQGKTDKDILPYVIDEKICNESTLKSLQTLLRYVVDTGTARKLFIKSGYEVAGKTGTNLFYEQGRGYKDSVFQSSFVGYFPADAPKYSCIVVIKNKPRAINYYGASVSGPVFRDIADGVMALGDNLDESMMYYNNKEVEQPKIKKNKTQQHYIVKAMIPISYTNTELVVPNFVGTSITNAVTQAELLGLNLTIEGQGANIYYQNISAGTKVLTNSNIKIQLQ